MAARDNFSTPTKREIAERAGYICSHPNCGRMTVGPSADRAGGITMTGVAAHIAAAAAGGPRSDATLSSAKRSAATNGIWMCATHAKWIDDNPSLATVEKLREWKSAHEAEISAWIEHGHPGIFRSWDRLAALTRDQRDTIETSLPNGCTIVRDGASLLTALAASGMCLVIGDSGVGKSALVKSTLDAHFPDARQVWLGPEALKGALSEAEREQLGLTAPLPDLLNATTTEQNILVLDAVERANAATIARLSQLVADLARHRIAGEAGWQIVAIGQRAGFEVHLDPLVNALDGNVVAVPPLEPAQVQEALQTVPVLAQHAYDDSFVALLDNLRTLGWIIAAGLLFAGAGASGMAARSQIADRLWAHWTGGDPELHSFMIALARRDAEYERSFALSELSSADRTAWKAGRQRMPLKLSDRNRLSFQHDLASDWARYEYLKEIADEVTRWAALASHPLWVGGLRLFGQFLLREQGQGQSSWDRAFSTARLAGTPDAIDVLLDALCLDPQADDYLSARTGLLFADNGKLLDRLLGRFMHIATVPMGTVPNALDAGARLYAEAEMRSPVWSSWPPLIRFLVAHRSTIGGFGSRIVAKVCEFWLTKTPTHVDGQTVLGRSGIAELALETARVHQVKNIAYGFHGGGSNEDGLIFTAALAGAEDRLDAVTAFALEMSRRRALAKPTQVKVDALRAAERRRRNEAERRWPQRGPRPRSLSSFGYRKLPPWPLGPAGRLNEGFRKAVLRNGALKPLTRVAPGIAAEVLLACIIDDTPHEEPGMRLERYLGLDTAHDERPSMFWNSPFFPFLFQAPEPALETLLQLVEFSTERWASNEGGETSRSIRLILVDGTARSYLGDGQVLDWALTRRATNSQLYSALDALERWLWLKIEGGQNVDDLCTRLLERSGSAAILGILANCAKQDPRLLRGALAPLLTSPILILRDEHRLRNRFGHDVFTWYRAGEQLRALGLEWDQAPHRRVSLKEVIRDQRRTDPAFDGSVREAVAAWPTAEDGMALRQRALAAELDPAHWHQSQDEEGETAWTIRYPDEIAAAIEATRTAEPIVPNFATVLGRLEAMLGSLLSAEQASGLYQILDEEDWLAHFDPVERRIIETAIAALLFARAGDWSVDDQVIMERLSLLLEQSVPPLENIQDPLDTRLDHGPGLVWASIGAIFAKAAGRGLSARWDRILALGLATGDVGVVGTIAAAARGLREELGYSYHAIIEAAVFAAALNELIPRMMEEPGYMAAVSRWRRRLARRPLTASRCSGTVDLVALSQRVERLWRSRYRRSSGDRRGSRHIPRRRFTYGLDVSLLAATFDWALKADMVPPEEQRWEHRQVLSMLWNFVDWRLRDDPHEPVDEHDGFDRLDDFGLTLIRTIAARIPLGRVTESRSLWEPVLALGPRGEFTLEHLIDLMFLRLYEEVDQAMFIANWDAMLAYVFAPSWANGDKWWKTRSILRHMLGINAAHQIANKPDVMAHVRTLAPYYQTFAANHIAHDDSTLAAFATFFASAAGAELRLQAIRWIEVALAEEGSGLRSDGGGALADLAQVLLTEHSAELVADRVSLQALNNVIGRMVRDQIPYALALQDRARLLR